MKLLTIASRLIQANRVLNLVGPFQKIDSTKGYDGSLEDNQSIGYGELEGCVVTNPEFLALAKTNSQFTYLDTVEFGIKITWDIQEPLRYSRIDDFDIFYLNGIKLLSKADQDIVRNAIEAEKLDEKLKDNWFDDYLQEKHEFDRSHPNYYDNEPPTSNDSGPYHDFSKHGDWAYND